MKFQKGLGSWLHFPWNSVSYRYSIINPQNVSFSKTTRPSLSNVNQADGTDGKKDTSRFTMPVRAPIIFFSNGAHRHRQKKHATDHPCLHTPIKLESINLATQTILHQEADKRAEVAIGTLEHGLYHSNPIATRTSTATAASSS